MSPAPFRALLFDLDGVFHVGDELLPGAVETLELLRSRRIPFRIITNTTTRSRASLVERMRRIGLPLEVSDLINAPYAAALYLRKRQSLKCRLVVAPDTLEEFDEVIRDEIHPDVIVLGDVEDRMSYDLLNSIFNQMMNGAELIALHKGRYWQTPQGLKVDLGVFVAGLEYTTGKPATVIGKPSRPIFELALSEIGARPSECAMIGDDIYNDVGGALGAGLTGILIKTGKFRPGYDQSADVVPDRIIASLSEIQTLIA